MHSYARLRHRRAWADTRATWSAHQTLGFFSTGIVGLFIAVVLRAFWPALESLNTVGTAIFALVIIVGGYLVAILGSYVINYIWSSPRVLHEEQRVVMEQHKRTIQRIEGMLLAAQSKPQRTVADEQRLAKIREVIAKRGPHSLIVLRHLQLHGKISVGFYTPPTPPEMNHDEMVAMLNDLLVDHLVILSRIHSPGGYDRVFEIAPGYGTVMDQALYD